MKPVLKPAWAVLVILLFAMMLSPVYRPADVARSAGEEPEWRLHFLPSQTRQLCQGDTATFTVWQVYYEPREDPDYPLAPLVPPGDTDPLAPLGPSYVTISATKGTVSPDRFESTGPSNYFSFTYSAAGAGEDTITAVMDDGVAKVEKHISILPSCDYDISFLVFSGKSMNNGGFYMNFTGDGDFGVNRTGGSVGELNGNGQDDLAWLMWAFAKGAATCTMDKVTASSDFNVEGMLKTDPYNYLYVNILFPKPIEMPNVLTWRCTAVGIGDFTMPVDVSGQNSSDPSSMDMVGLTFPLHGGVEELSVPDGVGFVAVIRR